MFVAQPVKPNTFWSFFVFIIARWADDGDVAARVEWPFMTVVIVHADVYVGHLKFFGARTF